MDNGRPRKGSEGVRWRSNRPSVEKTVDAADRKQRPAEGDGLTVGTFRTNSRVGLSTRGAEGTKRVNVPIDPGQHYQDDRDTDQ